MPAKILAFDPNRRVPPRRYTPIAMRGRLLVMPSRPAAVEDKLTVSSTADIAESCAKKSVKSSAPFLVQGTETAVERSS